MLENIYLYYTNDFHSYFDQWPKVATYLKNVRKQRERMNDTYYLFDIGDHVDRVSPITEATLGKANIELLNDLQYDVVTIGNNEGITLPREALVRLYDQATFDVVCTNLTSLNRVKPHWLQDAVTLESKHGVKIAVFGLTAAFNPFYHLLGWHVRDPFTVIREYITNLKQTHDIVILLSHLGLNEDEEIARQFPDIDLIIGGHTHHLLRTGKMVHNTLLTAAGKHSMFIGEVILQWDTKRKQLANKEAYTTELAHVKDDIETKEKLAFLEREANYELDKVVTTLEEDYEVDWFTETRLIREFTETIKDWTDADCAMLNAGVLLDGLKKGDVTYRDIHRICPHPMNPCLVEITGDELMEVVRVAYTKQLIHYPLKGFGFRGEVIGQMSFAGLDIDLDETTEQQIFVKSVRHDGEELVSNKMYRLATADTFTFGRLFPEIARARVKQFFLPEFLRDVLVSMLKVKESKEFTR